MGVRIGAAFAWPASDDGPRIPSYPLTLIASFGALGVGAAGIRILYQRRIARNPDVAHRHRMRARTVVFHR